MREKEADSVHDPLIQRKYNKEEEEGGGLRRQVFDEVKKQMELAGPLIAVSFMQFSLEMISIMFVGHLGQLQLSSAAMATCFASSTGFSVLLGMGGALETLCGQAYGAKQYHMLGIQMQRGMLILTAVSIPLAFLWFYTAAIFIALGQDEEISIGAGIFIRWMIPSLFAYGLLQCLDRFLQTQNIVVPMMIISGITALFHVFLCWLLVFRLGLEIKGAGLAISISNWMNVVLFGMYVKFSPACRDTWTGFSKEALHDLLSFFKLAVPSTVMTCFEYWSFDMVVLLSGLLPNPMLETSVLAISLDTCFMVYNITLGLGGAISTRVSNELGAGRPKAAHLAVCVSVVIAILEGLIVVAITILLRHVWGKLFSNDEEVIKYVAKMIPLLALTDFLDGLQCVLSGAARGCGWQNVCAFINLGAYYIVGIPCALILAFVLHVGGMGLWMGIICALSIQVVALIAINLSTNWTNEARKAINRVETSIGLE